MDETGDAERILVAGTGRMGKGIAIAFACAGHPVVLADSEERNSDQFAETAAGVREHLARELRFLADMDVLSARQSASIGAGIRIVARADAAEHIHAAGFVFEAVTEREPIKRSVYAWLNRHLRATTVVSSTTSTMSADHLATFIDRSERFVNAHWLNPAHLIPLVEVSPGELTAQAAVEAMKGLLTSIGKIPVVCRPSPGFIVPRIQAVALNEAARLVEEGVASVEDVDRAVKAGFGIRFATMGLLEFIDWGGGDTLYHATRYLGRNLDPQRFGVPDIVRDNMQGQRNGLRDGAGFYAWADCDIDEYRRGKLADIVRLLRHLGMLPGALADAREEVVDTDRGR